MWPCFTKIILKHFHFIQFKRESHFSTQNSYEYRENEKIKCKNLSLEHFGVWNRIRKRNMSRFRVSKKNSEENKAYPDVHSWPKGRAVDLKDYEIEGFKQRNPQKINFLVFFHILQPFHSKDDWYFIANVNGDKIRGLSLSSQW